MRIEGLTFIYKLTNPKGAIYIGQAKNLNKRFNQYKCSSSSNGMRITNSILSHGWEVHKKEIIDLVESHLADSTEIYWIKYFNSYNKLNPEFGMNLTEGGKGQPKEQMKKMSNANIGRKNSAYQAQRVRETHNIPILQYDLQGNFIKEWESTTIAVKELGLRISAIGNIRQCISGNEDFPHSQGYLWKDKFTENYSLKIEPARVNKYYKAKIKSTNLITGEEIIFDNAQEANKYFKTHIHDAIKNRNGYMKRKQLKFEIVK